MKYFIIAGEASGDLHGSNLVKALRQEDPAARIECWGGDLMENAGAVLRKHYRELAFMGFVEVVSNLRTILRNFKACKTQILDFQPVVLILIDYPGFNLRMASWAKEHGIRVFYYITPQLWAWKSSRVKIMRRSVDSMFVIFPFEKDFYRKYGLKAEFFGHPMLDVAFSEPASPDFLQKNNLAADKPIIALLPGSRRQEIRHILPVMLQASKLFPDYQFVIAIAPSLKREFYDSYLTNHKTVLLVVQQTYDLLKHARAALVTSGTATLETALLGVPQVVCYKANPFSVWLAKRLVNKDLKFISIVNLIAGKKVVEELIQEELNAERINTEMSKLLTPEGREAVLQGYAFVRAKLGTPGASGRVAKRMGELLRRE